MLKGQKIFLDMLTYGMYVSQEKSENLK